MGRPFHLHLDGTARVPLTKLPRPTTRKARYGGKQYLQIKITPLHPPMRRAAQGEKVAYNDIR
jgi:hypothetical protein